MAKLENDHTIQHLQNSTKKTKRSDSGVSVCIRKEVESRPLPDPTKNVKPVVFLQDLIESMHGFRPVVKSALKMNDYFPKVTEEQIAAYDVSMTTAARNNDLEAVKKLYSEGRSVDCCNRFGESLLHLACRRGFVELGEFLLQEAKLNVRISEDMGRNPFHDICWNPTVQIELALLLLERDPTLLLIGDKRGHTPFDYARPQDWPEWRAFLYEHRDMFEPLQGDSATRELFSS
eukprot:CAMPEP_0119012706 /NCGR_PEP_ID=MMETSP1176-20130426/7312_1 /TAXON_ID=265551 /ORGANISM="Synedropsis recta cf, Strain CCMP1620" /LENGTH=232 /DNA_ID=CAMNT_0006965717 /DNA_START=316 /DNA_END=1014 /DNA_ORIENTATION=+